MCRIASQAACLWILAGRSILWTLQSQKGPIRACHLTDDKIRLQMVSSSFGILSLFAFACQGNNTRVHVCVHARAHTHTHTTSSGRVHKQDCISGCCTGGPQGLLEAGGKLSIDSGTLFYWKSLPSGCSCSSINQ